MLNPGSGGGVTAVNLPVTGVGVGGSQLVNSKSRARREAKPVAVAFATCRWGLPTGAGKVLARCAPGPPARGHRQMACRGSNRKIITFTFSVSLFFSFFLSFCLIINQRKLLDFSEEELNFAKLDFNRGVVISP